MARRPFALTLMLACAFAAPATPAAAKLRLPPGANKAPELPAGVVPAERPPLSKASTQRRSRPMMAAAGKVRYFMNEGPRPYWATVNICDTSKSPNGLGVRTSVPGNGSEERVYARFTAQWWSAAKQQWLNVAGAGTTDWVYVGTSEYTAQQAGWTYRFSSPPGGTTYVLRGVTELVWRAEDDRRDGKWDVVRRRTLLTETGMEGVRGGDPVGTSKAMCLLW